MARDGQSRTKNVQAAAGRELLRELDTQKKPTNLLRTLVALLSLYNERDSRWFASDDVMDKVNEHASENEEKLGPRTRLYVLRYSMNMLERKGYLRLEGNDTHTTKIRKPAAEMMQRITEQMDSQSFPSAMERHRALCDHFRQRIGPMKRPTYSELDRENREYRQSISDHKKVCTYNRLQSPASDSDNDDPMNDIITYMDQPTSTILQELIAGPSNSASIFPVSPVRKSLSTDFARAAYPSPESLPRPRIPRPLSSSSPPASPTPQSRTSGSQNGDLDIEMDDPGLGQLEDLRNTIETLQEQNDALEKETKQINTERTTLNEKLEAALKRVKALELELECINAELDERDGAVRNLQEQISFLEDACSADAIFHADELEVLSGLLQESKDEVAGLKEAFVRAARARVEQEKREFLALGLTHPFE